MSSTRYRDGVRTRQYRLIANASPVPDLCGHIGAEKLDGRAVGVQDNDRFAGLPEGR